GPEVNRPPLDLANIGVEPGASSVRFSDVNGDGLVDAVWLTDDWMKIYLGTGDGSFVPEVRAFYPWHDGRDVESPGVIRPTDIALADLDRDGLVDLLVTNTANVAWFRGEAELGRFGEFRKLTRPDGVAIDAVVAFGDANGNGSEDVIWSSPTGLRVLDFAGATSAGMVERIDNGLGMVMDVAYRPSAVLAVQAEAAGQAWERKLPVSIPVPVSLTTTSGPFDPVRAVELGVRDGFWDGVERRFGGFLLGRRATVAASGAATLVEETEYHPGLDDDRVLRGFAFRTVQKSALDEVFTISETDYEARRVGGLPDVALLRAPVVLSEETTNLEGVEEPIRTRSSYDYDAECRRMVERHEGRLDVAGDEKVVRRDYTDDIRRWVRNLVCDERTLEGDDETLRSETFTSYGSDTELLEPCAGASNGWVRDVSQRLLTDTEDRLISQSSMSYDALGNPLLIVENGVRRQLGYDPAGLHVTSETLPDAGLAWTGVWDDMQQLPLSVTDPNGVTVRVTYDALGRASTVALGDEAPHVRYEYRWEAPSPRTTRYLLDRSLDEPRPTFPNGAGWRTVTAVTNGAGEARFEATRLSANRFIVSDWVERDERGKIALHAEPFYAESLDPVRAPEARTQLFHFDALGRVDRQTLSNGAVKTTTFRAFEQIVQEPELAPVTLVSDGFSRVIRNERQVGAAIERLDARYDAADRVLEYALLKPRPPNATQDAFVTQTYEYDTLGRLVSADDPDIGPRELEYDDRNLLLRHTNAAGQVAAFDYDAVNRLEGQGEGEPDDDVFTYDASQDPSAVDCHLRGRLARVVE
ncbi:MAG TPA: toxin TcdB middle/N-terminal domain-containing protein, partial [Polyangiaceae bacterium]|nr:toxin TcdB middle/N-terminal domain-containing protein [Polyangiaceae bacterium]